MRYWFYENWRAHGHQARIHPAMCSFCNDGQGFHPDSGSDNGGWRGPYDNLDAAMQAAAATGANVSRCRQCNP